MFAKLAQFRAFNRAAERRFETAATPCNDNRRGRRFNAMAQRMRRPILVRRWHIAPSGRLECSWHLAEAKELGEASGMSRLFDALRQADVIRFSHCAITTPLAVSG